MTWSAAQYSKFLDDRTRPARDLLAAVPLQDPDRVVDLGCGPGNSTGLLVDRYAHADVTGLDSDPDMLTAARKALPECRFVQERIQDWRPQSPVDLIFANASLQWLDDHAALFPHLLGLLAPGGALAVQMPDNLDEPTHRAMRQVAADPRWAARLADASSRRKPLLDALQLHTLLRPLCRRLDVWRTVYQFELDGLDAIVDWFKGSALRPYLDALDPDEQIAFLSDYRDAVAPHYPQTAGRVLLAFPRAFFVAQKT